LEKMSTGVDEILHQSTPMAAMSTGPLLRRDEARMNFQSET
jgi:hypothetical protein